MGDTQHGYAFGIGNCYETTQACGEVSITEPGTYGLSQALATVEGQSYFVSIAYEVVGGTANADNTVEIAVDNTAGTHATADADLYPYQAYHTLTMQFVASSDTTTLTVSIGTAGTTGVLYFISAVTVQGCSSVEGN